VASQESGQVGEDKPKMPSLPLGKWKALEQEDITLVTGRDKPDLRWARCILLGRGVEGMRESKGGKRGWVKCG